MLLTYTMIETLTEFESRKDDLALFAPFVKQEPDEFLQQCKTWLNYLTLVYLGEKAALPVAVVCVFPSKRSCELHGVFRQDLKRLNPAFRKVQQVVIDDVLRILFETKAKVIIKCPDSLPATKWFAKRNGFEFINREKDKDVYVLKKADWLNGRI